MFIKNYLTKNYTFMKTSNLFNHLICFVGLLLVCSTTKAQNASYNLNSVPINGSYCTAFGVGALASNATGNYNTANGYRSLYSNTTGFWNTANGSYSLLSNTSGNENTANGSYSLYSNTTGNYITANGISSLRNNTTGSNNTANGYNSLYNNTTGSGNTANGYRSLYSNTTGVNNIAIGGYAGFNSLGSNNVYIGNQAGYSETGSDKLYISNSSTNALIYGDFATHQLLLGVPNATGYVFKGSRTLNVMGGILTDSIRVALSNQWADYVFDENYKLKPLHELEQFIAVNKHLPNIPNAQEVKEKGINLAEINVKLLEKTEELTLYIIQQNKQIEQQHKRLNEQQKQIYELKNLILTKK
jgi:hypothetical protein